MPRPWACLRAILIAHSFASVPELAKKTRPPRLDSESRSRQPRPSARCRRGWRRASARRPAPARPRPRPGGSGRASRPRCRRGSRGTPCRRRPRAGRPRRARTRPAPACRSASGSAPRSACESSADGSRGHHRADAGVGEELEQQVWGTRPSMMWADWAPPLDRVDAGAAASAACRRRSPASRSSTSATLALRDQRALVAGVGEPALDVGEEDRLVGAERGRDLAGRLVGVDVVGLAVAVGGRARRSPGCSRRRCG